jgi:CRP/FNR family transcriptional regulator
MKTKGDSSWIFDFPHFRRLESSERSRVVVVARHGNLPVGSTVFEPGQVCDKYILVRSGDIRVGLIDAEGGEMILYRLGPGDSCVLTTATLLSDARYAAFAKAESDVEAVVIPKAAFREFLADSQGFREAVLADHGRRFIDLMSVIGALAFESIDHRLVKKLRQLSNGQSELHITHQALATELGTAREVVSRRLKHFERVGWVRLHKGRVEILETLPSTR